MAHDINLSMAHDINLNDPAVARLMGRDTDIVSPGHVAKPKMTTIAGDMDHGLTSTTRLDMGKHEIGVIVRPKGSDTIIDNVLTVDVYAIPGEPLLVNIVCPRCQHRLALHEDKACHIEWNPTAPCPFPLTLKSEIEPAHHYLALQPGVLSIESAVQTRDKKGVRCTWELEDRMQDANKDVHVISRDSLCRYEFVIHKNVLREV